MGRQRDKFTKKEWSWILYDWANSVYATNIMACIFPPIFVSMAGDAGDMWWGYGTSLATFLIAVLAPLLGAIADFKGMKKKFFTVFMLLGVVFTAVIALTNDWRWMLAAYVVSRIGFSGSNLFYDSFLTDVTDNDRMDRVSSWGYAMGYIGGSTIPFVLSIAMLSILGNDSVVAQKFAILITSVWWLIFTVPFLKNVEQTHYIETEKRPTVSEIFANIGKTARDIVSERGLFLFVIAYFFYIDGVGTIINISTAYGASLGLGLMGMIIALLVTQIVAMPCSILFGQAARRVGTRRALLFAVGVYMFICLVGFVMGYTLEPHQDAYQSAFSSYKSEKISALQVGFQDKAQADKAIEAYVTKSRDLMRDNKLDAMDALKIRWSGMTEEDAKAAEELTGALAESNRAFLSENGGKAENYRKAISFSSVLFWGMAVLVGTVQGGIQATSRSCFGKLIPKERSNEFFGFFDIFGKFASVIGPLLYATVGGMTGRSSLGTLCLLILFIIGFCTLLRAKKPLEALEKTRAAQEA